MNDMLSVLVPRTIFLVIPQRKNKVPALDSDATRTPSSDPDTGELFRYESSAYESHAPLQHFETRCLNPYPGLWLSDETEEGTATANER
jgi:hypothetical protein